MRRIFRLRRRLAAMTVALGAALLPGCTPESRHSLPDELRILPDARFVGAWQSRSDDGAAIDNRIVARVAADPARPLALRATLVEDWTLFGQSHRRSGDFRLQFYDVAGRRVLAAQRLGADGDGAWRFAVYRFGGDSRIVLNFLDEERSRELVHAARLPGRIRGGEREFPDVLLTASPSQLAALVRATEPSRLFVPRLGPFERLP